MKRLEVSIVSKRNPEEVLSGYALVTELNDSILTFFSTKKFKIDEQLTLCLRFDGDDLEFQLRMSHQHEQISSGRIMTVVPSEANPFPGRKFYRCFAKVLEVKQNGQTIAPVVALGTAPTETAAVETTTAATPPEDELKVA